MSRFLKLKEIILKEINSFRNVVGAHPKVIVWRLQIFNYSPFLSKHIFKIFTFFIIIFSFYISFYIFSWRSPRPFPNHALVSIERGETLSVVARSFREQGIIRSAFWLKTFVFITGGERRIVAGDYFFPKPISIFGIVNILHKGDFGLIAEKITIHEGLSSFEIADLLEQRLFKFNRDNFINEVKDNDYEGYLFPDTYFFPPNIKAGDVILTMRENFARQIKDYEEDILKSEKSLNDIIIIASIIENEANGNIESKRIISGILWKRLKLKMSLQVDAPFKYYNGKHSYTLTKEDLKEDHPYNTYINKGLPPTAIGNPGIDSIRAAIAPTNTDYLFFMSDKSGNMYYARDFDGHQANRELYLR